MKYYVGFEVTSRYVAEVEANSIEEAKEEAEYQFSGVDFGESTDIDGVIKYIEDENGNRQKEE